MRPETLLAAAAWPSYLAVLIPLAIVAIVSLWRQRARQSIARRALVEARDSGLNEPASLHPVIDPTRCLGCATCVESCPEHGVLRIIDGQAHLVDAVHCVGHGRCKEACPTEAIELVFGTPKRPMHVPVLGDDLQSTVPGLYVAGELGGVGLIRNALTQGMRVVEAMTADLRPAASSEIVDVAIVGGGPAGIAAALSCRQRGLSHLVLEQDGLGGSVHHYPRQKLVMTAPVDLPLVGRMHFKEVLKEELAEYWLTVRERAQLMFESPVQVNHIRPNGTSFIVESGAGEVRAQRVVLAIGRGGTPRKLGVPGEDLGKVAYRLLEPERYSGQDVLVVGGGNSAVEAATSLVEARANVTLSYRGEHFKRVAAANLTRLEALRGRNLCVEMPSQVARIEPGTVVLRTAPGERTLANQQVFVCIGGQLPTTFLERVGIEMATYTGESRGAARPARLRRQVVMGGPR